MSEPEEAPHPPRVSAIRPESGSADVVPSFFRTIGVRREPIDGRLPLRFLELGNISANEPVNSELVAAANAAQPMVIFQKLDLGPMPKIPREVVALLNSESAPQIDAVVLQWAVEQLPAAVALIRRALPSRVAIMVVAPPDMGLHASLDIMRSGADVISPQPLSVDALVSLWQHCLRRDPDFFEALKSPSEDIVERITAPATRILGIEVSPTSTTQSVTSASLDIRMADARERVEDLRRRAAARASATSSLGDYSPLASASSQASSQASTPQAGSTPLASHMPPLALEAQAAGGCKAGSQPYSSETFWSEGSRAPCAPVCPGRPRDGAPARRGGSVGGEGGEGGSSSAPLGTMTSAGEDDETDTICQTQ